MKSLVSDLIQSERKRCVRTPQVEAADFLLDHRRYDASVNLELGCTETETGLDQLLLFDHMARTWCQPQMGPCPVRTARDLVRQRNGVRERVHARVDRAREARVDIGTAVA